MSIDRERLAQAMSNHEDEREEERGDREHCCDFGCAPAIADAYEAAAPGVARDSLDVEWAAAEAALPEGSVDYVQLVRLHTGEWRAIADYDDIGSVSEEAVDGRAATPAAALRALTAALSTPETPGAHSFDVVADETPVLEGTVDESLWES